MTIIPRPVHAEFGDGEFILSPDTTLVADPAAQAIADQLADWLRPATGYTLPISAQPAANSITLAFDESLVQLGNEGYVIDVTANGVSLRAAQSAGLFYAAQSLRQLLPPQIFSPQPVADGTRWAIPCGHIEDQPRFGWRGMHLDVARHFMPLETIKRFIDLMAVHKLNVLHWHLTEDQGWRLDIKQYPLLTEFGAWRKETRVGHEREAKGFDGKRHGGFYTQTEAREVVAYAAARHINIVPEIEMPGHAQAAISAYPELGNTYQELEVGTRWGVIKHVLNVENGTIEFFKNVLREVMDIFPSQYIHIGGDECPKDEWKANPRAQARMRELNLETEDQLQSWFIRQMDHFLNENGRTLIGWDEILEGGLAQNAVVMSWRGEENGIHAAKAGHDVVMAPNSYTYFDYYQSQDKDKEPLAIGGFLPLEKVYSYEPIPAALNAEEAKHVLGAQAQLWTEYIPTPEHLDYMTYPRACALAEVVWAARGPKDFAEFQSRLAIHRQRLDLLGVNAHP